MAQTAVQFRLSQMLVAMALLALIVVDVVYWPSLYVTEGDIGQLAIAALLVIFWLVAAFCFMLFPRLRTAIVCIVGLICFVFATRQFSVMRRMDMLQPEVERVIEYVESYKTTHGQYPADLAGYSFERNELRPYIRYSPPSDSRYPAIYEIRYHPTHIGGIAHWYNPVTGFWFEDD